MTDEKTSGTIFNIQKFSVHDGEGIRTLVFFKGCPLRCRWCSNPESQNGFQELSYSEQDCLHCGTCEKMPSVSQMAPLWWIGRYAVRNRHASVREPAQVEV